MKYLSLLILGLLFNNIHAEANIQGRIISDYDVKASFVHHRLITDAVTEYQLELDEFGRFGISIELEQPVLLQLYINGDEYDVYASPNDSLYIKFNAKENSLKVEGKGAEKTWMLSAFNSITEGKTDTRKLTLTKGDLKFDSEIEAIAKAKVLTVTDVYVELQNEFTTADALIHQFNTETNISAEDLKFATTEMDYAILRKPVIFAAYQEFFNLEEENQEIPLDYFIFLDDFQFRDEKFNEAPNYIKFIQDFVAYKYFKALEKGIKTDLLSTSADILNDKSRDKLMTKIVMNTIAEKNLFEAQEQYKQYKTIVSDTSSLNIVRNGLLKTSKFVVNETAPNFNQATLTGETFDLYENNGKVVYINFWASWCAPCIKKIEKDGWKFRQLKQKGAEIVFVSLDKDESIWKRAVQKYYLKGTHLNSVDIYQGIAKLYKVTSLPTEFIIDKNGNFVNFTSKNYKEIIEGLLEE